jgi:PEP-CTERM motif
MMKTKVFASLAAVAVLSMGSAAFAAPVITYTPPVGLGSFAASFGNPGGGGVSTGPLGTFSDVYTPFTITTAGVLTGTLSTSGIFPQNDLDFTSATVTGPSGVIPFALIAFPLTSASPPAVNPDGFELGAITGVSLLPGTYTLAVAGVNAGTASSYAGTLSFAAVPEPAAWALMILGVGMIGFAMRGQRSAARYRVSYS